MLRPIRHRAFKTGNSGIPKIAGGVEFPLNPKAPDPNNREVAKSKYHPGDKAAAIRPEKEQTINFPMGGAWIWGVGESRLMGNLNYKAGNSGTPKVPGDVDFL